MIVRNKHAVSILALLATAIVWGAGFVLTKIMLKNNLTSSAFINTVRFSCATVTYLIFFGNKLKLDKTALLYGSVGGLLLFVGFMLQVICQRYTTPANCGFFSTMYIVFVPCFLPLINKEKPTLWAIISLVIAVVGLYVLNYGVTLQSDSTIGNVIALVCALCFGVQMCWCDKALTKVDSLSLVFVQMTTAAILFVITTLIELPTADYTQVNWAECIPCLAVAAILGTAGAYVAQTKAQQYLNPSETSLLLAGESVFGLLFSVAYGFDKFSWNLLIGSILMITAMTLSVVVPLVKGKKENDKTQEEQNGLQ